MENSVKTTNEKWNIPPESESGGVSWFEKITLKFFVKSKNTWLARAEEPKEKELIEIVNECCREMGISKIPKIIVCDSHIPNACSITLTGNIAFSTNLVEIMSRNQIKAITGHELTHHKERFRTLITLFGVCITNSILVTAASEFIQNKSQKFAEFCSKKHNISDALGTVITLLADFAILMWFSRKAEYRADLGGAKIAGTDAMISSLDTLSKRSQEIQKEEEKAGKKDHLAKIIPPFLASHPSIRKRYANLVEHAPKTYIEKHLLDKENSQKPQTYLVS